MWFKNKFILDYWSAEARHPIFQSALIITPLSKLSERLFLQLILLAVFGVKDGPLAPYVSGDFLELSFKTKVGVLV